LQAAHRPGFVMKIALGHARVIRAEDTFARAGPWFGEDGNCGYAGERAHRLHANAFHQLGILFQSTFGDHLTVNGDQHRLGNQPAVRLRVTPHGAIERAPGDQLMQDLLGELGAFFGEDMPAMPVHETHHTQIGGVC